MVKQHTLTAAALVAAFAFLAVLPAQAECSSDDCQLSPLQSRQVNPAPIYSDPDTSALSTNGSLISAAAGDMPLVSARALARAASAGAGGEQAADTTEPRALSSEPSAQSPVLPAAASVSTPSLDIRMRYQPTNPDDVSCGVQALGMALDGLDGAGPTSGALLSLLQDSGLLYEWGTGAEELAFAASQFGYEGVLPFHNWSMDQLKSELAAGRPVVIALGANGEDVPGHFVTLTGISADGQWLRYNDPILGEQTVHRAVFEALWDRQGRSGVAFGATAAGGSAPPQHLGWLAFAAGLMALVSQTPWGTRRQGIGGRLMQDSGSVSPAARPPYAAPAGMRWRAAIVPQYETETVQDGWTTITRRVPNMVRVREQVGSRTYYEKIPKFKTVRVQDGWRWDSRQVPTYKTVTFVRYYTTRSRRVPTPWGWRTVRQRVPVYGSRRVRTGSRTEWRRVPKMVDKQVPDGYHTIERPQPVYAWVEKQHGYRTVEKRVPRMVEQKTQVGSKVAWELVDNPRSSIPSMSGGVGLASIVPAGNDPSLASHGDDPPEDDQDLLDYLADQLEKPELWWGLLTDETSVSLLKNAEGVPDIAVTLPMLKGFGRQVPVPPMRYVIPGDTAVRTLGRVGGDTFLGTWAVGLVITLAPSQYENIRTNAPISNRLADAGIDTFGFGASEVIGTVAAGLSSELTVGAVGVKFGADALAGAFYDMAIDNYNVRQQFTNAIEIAPIAFGNVIGDALEDALTRDIPPIPTPDPKAEPSSTPTPSATASPGRDCVDCQ